MPVAVALAVHSLGREPYADAVDRINTRLEVPARQGRRVRPGQPVRLGAAGTPGEVQGRVVSIDPRSNNAIRTFLVKAELDHPASPFRNGERVHARLIIGAAPAARPSCS